MAKKKYLSITGLADLWALIKNRLTGLDTALGEAMTQIARVRYHLRLIAGGSDAQEFSRMEDLSGVTTEMYGAGYVADTDTIVYDTSRKQFMLIRIEKGTISAKPKYFNVFGGSSLLMGEIDAETGLAVGNQPRAHVTYLDAETGRSYRWNGSDLTEYALFNNRAVTCDPVVARDTDDCKGASAGVRTFLTDSTTANMPAADSKYGSITTTTISSVHHIQVFTSFSASTECWTRRCFSGTWGNWVKKY